VLLFADTGRVWADYSDVRVAGVSLDERDSNVPGNLSIGIGTGLRLQWGETFIIRADPGFSPTDGTFGFYLDLAHIF